MELIPDNNNVSEAKLHLDQQKYYKSKWNILFEKYSEWISFRPQLGIAVYPCYSCRNMFSSKSSFLDHINRRTMVLQYDCPQCIESCTFFNRCSFLLHTRDHFSLNGGVIDLNRLEMSLLPVHLAGFTPHPEIKLLFNEDEVLTTSKDYINAQFYSPNFNDTGKRVVTLKPSDLLFQHTIGGEVTSKLAIKQICKNVPKCIFITLDYQRLLKKQVIMNEISVYTKKPNNQGTKRKAEKTFVLPVISKIESLHQPVKILYPNCPECNTVQKISMTDHFLNKNIPSDSKLSCPTCKYIAPTACSLKAHIRIHSIEEPYVCPECGKSFESVDEFRTHLQDVCFHLAKQARFRCPGRKCGKLFALTATYMAHFDFHIKTFFQCNICKEVFHSEEEFSSHTATHEQEECISTSVYQCLVCRQTTENFLLPAHKQSHILWHISDRSRCLYVYICRCCKKYFRSPSTYATHLIKCSKINVTKNHYRYWPTLIMHDTTNPDKSDKTVESCTLCNESCTDLTEHTKICKYARPRVRLLYLPQTVLDSCNANITSGSESGSRDVSFSEQSNDSPTKSDGSPKKKKRRSVNLIKLKKPSTISREFDLTVEKPQPFTGTYICRLCDYKNDDRREFHEHVIALHRDIITSYQCMECGECFVVKPSFIKHLHYFHNITDIDKYFEENNCFDKNAVKELEENLKLAPGETRGPLKENQCRVCLKIFDDAKELNIHFRVHGMAFLMKNVK